MRLLRYGGFRLGQADMDMDGGPALDGGDFIRRIERVIGLSLT